MPITLPALCLVTLVLCNVHGSLEHGIPRRSFLSRRAIDGTRGRKYFDPDEEGAFDSYGSAGGQYDPYEEKTDLSDIRRNVPGEPGVDYPAYTTLPQTGFTCEERSRGYYADEVAGCQVFHVCHDVLVSSFLCPIGSIFSQKLLTCDWWTKVDCSSSSKYIDVNRNSYQQDDDEMIRNAYAMISLQSGMDVTEEGLVDPDRTGSIVDYQRNPSRILDYSPQDTTGNDLKSNFDNYAGPISRDFLPPYQLKDGKETSRSYHGRFFGKSRSPYEDSPIIRVQKINDPNYEGPIRNTDFQQSYQRPNEFTNHFQPSYAPTVPTVTTTTRRFYSPTVPTTFRPSTVAYNKLDQDIDSSDYYFSQSRTKSFVTPPTLRKSDADDDYTRQDSYEDYEDINSEETRDGRSKERFQVRVADNLNFNRTGSSSERRPFLASDYRDFSPIRYNEEFVDDFETRGSIGLGHALHDSFRGISVQDQNPVQKKSKDETGSRTEDVKHALIKPEAKDKDETTNRYNDETEEFVRDDVFVPSTTPSVIESTIKASTSPQETSKFPNSEFLPPDIDRKDNFRTVDLLKPSRSKFQIKVPDLIDVTSSPRYSFQTEGTTELPAFHTTYPDDYIDHSTSLDENSKVTSNYGNVETTTEGSYQNDQSTIIRSLISRIASRFPSSSPHSLDVKNPSNDYNDSPTEGSSNRHLPITSFDLENHQSNTERQSSVEDSTLSPVFLHSSKSISLNETSKENLTQNLNKTSIISDNSSKDNRRLIYRNSDELRQNSGERDSIEAATVNTSPKSIRSEILKQIEKTIGIGNSPYQVTASKDQETVPTEEDFVSKITVQQDKQISAHNDKIHELEIVKSVDPLIRRTQLETTTEKTVNSRDESHPKNTTELDNFKNRRTVSLLQLMSELLKLDRVPRPFSFSNTQNISPRTTIRNLSLNTELGDETTTDYQETSTEDFRTSVPRSKEEILGQLAENFGDPLYGTGRKSFDLPENERSISFRTELPYGGTENSEESKVPTTTARPTPRSTETTLETIVTTEKTVVKTEFVPSIGFSFDTNEGREEYVEAVLGGLIEPQPAESKREETILKERIGGDGVSKKNETLAKN